MFENAGFNLFHGLLDAIDFGVPQYRPRVFVVGINKKYKGRAFHFPQSRSTSYATVADVIKDLPEPVFFRRNIDPETIPFHPNHWTMQPKSSKFSNDFLKEGQNFGRSFRVLSWSKPSWSVAYGNREIHIHPSCKRRLSIYEAMQLQGFPKDYRLFGNLSSQVHQVSDAIPPQVASALGNSIYNFLSTIDTPQHPTLSGEDKTEDKLLQEI